MSISQPPIEGDATEVFNVTDRFLSVPELDNSLRNVTITVTAIDRVGRRNDSILPDTQLPESKGRFVLYICIYVGTDNMVGQKCTLVR